MSTSKLVELNKSIVLACGKKIRDMLVEGIADKVMSVKDDGDPTTAIDLEAELIAKSILSSSPDISLFSEENGMISGAGNTRYIAQLDPVDGTFLALRGLPGACTAMSIFDKESNRPISAAVFDLYSGDLYWADDKASFLNGNTIRPSKVTGLAEAFISTCYGKKSRLHNSLMHKGLLNNLFWLGTTGGILDMVYVASGKVDAYIDLMLGYKIYDFAAGAFIAHMAGAAVIDRDGNALSYPRSPTERKMFVIAATPQLGRIILEAANN